MSADDHVLPLPFKTILLLGAHADDGEWGCGASVHKWIRQGARVIYVAFSDAAGSLKPEFPRDILRKEILDGADAMGLAREDVRVLDFKVRCFPEYRQLILETLVALRREFSPDAVLIHGSDDTHQDHETLARETFRAFKQGSMLGYELPPNYRTTNLNYFCTLSDEDVEAKVRAMQAYKSQAWRYPHLRAIIEGLATTRGSQIGERWAEAFEVLRWVER